ncbi:BTAD domain-containing putative transcriptional regulator [Streptomyces sp. GD-15H]
MTGTTYVDLLGQLSVRHDDRPVSIRSLKQRHLLATLALHAGQVVSHEKIIDALWGENPPATSLALVHTYVARLRKALQPGCDSFRADSASPSLIRHTGTGYRLDLGTDQVDLLRFLDLAAKAHEEHATRNAERAEELFHEALRIWRGSVLADLDHRLGQDPVVLNAVHLRLTSTLAYADLALERGHFHEVVPQLQSVTPEEPLHEGLHARLMLALAEPASRRPRSTCSPPCASGSPKPSESTPARRSRQHSCVCCARISPSRARAGRARLHGNPRSRPSCP